MYLPRALASQLYHSLSTTCTPSSSPVLILPAASDADALCATRILTALLKRDFIPHKIHPVGGYGDLERAGQALIQPMKYSQGGNGGVVICLGVGGLVDLGSVLGFEADELEEKSENDYGGVEIWVFDKRRPWNLGNVFGGIPGLDDGRPVTGVQQGKIGKSYRPGRGGIVVFDDGDIEEELENEKAAFFALAEMPEVEDADDEIDDSESETEDAEEAMSHTRKRKSDAMDSDSDDSDSEGRPRQRRRSNSGSSIASPSRRRDRSLSIQDSATHRPSSPKGTSAKTLRRRLLKLRRSHEDVLRTYYNLGTSYSEPVSSLLYSLASELGREDNDLLWLAVVGVSSLELSGHIPSDLHNPSTVRSHSEALQVTRHKRIQATFRDEVRRLNPPSTSTSNSPTEYSSKSSPTDSSIRLSPEPHLILLRHWSLYESMLHSPFLASRLHTWNDSGKKRLHKLLAKMGVSLQQCKQVWTHMDVDLKKSLRERLSTYAVQYGIEGVVPESDPRAGLEGWGFIKSWGWKASLSAIDVVTIVGAILDVGPHHVIAHSANSEASGSSQRSTATSSDEDSKATYNFFPAYDALATSHPKLLLSSLPLAQHLCRSILRTGTSLLSKNQIRHLRSFRMAVVKDGPDLELFSGSVGALIKLAGWVDQALRATGKGGYGKDDVPLVVAALDSSKGVYVVVGLGAGSNSYLQEEASNAAAKRREKEEKRKKKEEEREKKRKVREERKEIERRARALDQDSEDEEEEEETESEPSDSDSDDSTPPTSPSSSSQADKAPLAQKRRIGNRFGHAFQEVSENTNADVKVDHFDHCVVEVKKEELGTFLEALSMACVVG